jgi:hypothetical protein
LFLAGDLTRSLSTACSGKHLSKGQRQTDLFYSTTWHTYSP